MIRGIYTAAQGMIADQFHLDTIAGNLANVNTVGYKQDIPTFKAFHDMSLNRYEHGSKNGTPIGKMSTGIAFDRTYTDMTNGGFTNTRNPLDVAIAGDGLFALQTPKGEQYTRSGQFRLQPNGNDANGKPTSIIVSEGGHPVLGVNGQPINVGSGQDIQITEEGKVIANKVEVGKLKIVTAKPDTFKKTGYNLWSANGNTQPSTAKVKQGFLEQANINPVQAMVEMITVQRAYDASQKTIHAQDESLGKIINGN